MSIADAHSSCRFASAGDLLLEARIDLLDELLPAIVGARREYRARNRRFEKVQSQEVSAVFSAKLALICSWPGERITLADLRIGGREGFIPAPGELVSKGLFELPEYPYLRKYLTKKDVNSSA